MKELAAEYPGILVIPTSLELTRVVAHESVFIAPNPLLNGLADLPIKVPFHSIIGHLGPDEGPHSTDGLVEYYSAHLEGAESEKRIPAGHYLWTIQKPLPKLNGFWRRISRGERRSFKRAATLASRTDSVPS